MRLIPLDDGATKLARPPSTFINVEVGSNVEYLDILNPSTLKTQKTQIQAPMV